MRLDWLGHEIDFAGGEDIGIENIGQILNGDKRFRLEFGYVRVLRHGHTRIEDRQRHIAGHPAHRIERGVRHVARNDDGSAEDFQLEIRRNRRVWIELELRQVRWHKRARIEA